MEQELQLPAGALQRDGLYPRTLTALIDHGLVESGSAESYTVTSAADEILRPEYPDTVQQLARMLSAVDDAAHANGPTRSPVISEPDSYLSQYVDYTHWAIFTDPSAAEACATDFNALPGCTATVGPPDEYRAEWLLRADRPILVPELAQIHSEARQMVERHGGIYDGGEATHPPSAAGAHPAAAAFPGPPRPSTTATTSPSTTAPQVGAAPTAAPRHGR